MKTKLLSFLVLSLLTTQAAVAAKGDFHCTFNTNKGMAFLAIDQTRNGGLMADLNLQGTRVVPYESVAKSSDVFFPKFTSTSLELILDLKNTYSAPMGNTGVNGLLSLKDRSFGVNLTRVKCEIKNK